MWQIEFDLPRSAPEACQNMLSEAFETMLIFESEDKTSWQIKLIMDQEPTSHTQDLIHHITQQFEIPQPHIHMAKLPKTDWLSENRKAFPAMSIAGFFIHGSHLEGNNDDNLIPIKVDASLAFGTGEHATTRGCLEMIASLDEPAPHNSILDLGCGTAILAIAMAKIWDREIWASDIDEDSALMAWQNCIDNDVGSRVHTLQSDGFNHPILEEKAPFALIVANILAQPLCELAPHMKKNLMADGRIILSGLLVEQKDLVQQTYEANGFQLLQEKIIGEWATLLLKAI